MNDDLTDEDRAQREAELEAEVRIVLDGTPDPTQWFDKEEGLLVMDLGCRVRELGTVRLGHDGCLYRYHDGVYRPDGEAFAKVTTKMILDFKWKRRHAEEVLAWLRADYPFIPAQPSARRINVRNGLLDWRTGRLGEHTPDEPSAIQLPVAWKPTATCPLIDKFLRDVLPDDAIDFFHEIAGYALYAGNPLSKAVMTLGPGGNGKSTILKLLRSLVGPNNFAAVTLQNLAEHRFYTAKLFGKLANICGDIDKSALKRTDQFKQVTGGDEISAEHKFGHPFTFTAITLPIFSANEAPITPDQSDAYFDRWLILPMEKRIRGTAMDDPFIDEKITAKSELEGFLVQAIHGLQRLMERGRFDEPASVVGAGDVYRSRLDSVRGFLEDECILSIDGWTPRAALYRHYNTWCRDNGRLTMSSTTFNDHLRRRRDLNERARRGTWGWFGIDLLAARGDQ